MAGGDAGGRLAGRAADHFGRVDDDVRNDGAESAIPSAGLVEFSDGVRDDSDYDGLDDAVSGLFEDRRNGRCVAAAADGFSAVGSSVFLADAIVSVSAGIYPGDLQQCRDSRFGRYYLA